MAIYPLFQVNMGMHGLACTGLCCQGYMADQCDEYLVYIDQITTTPELWAKLQAIFKSKVAVGIVNIRQEFFQTFARQR